MKKVRQLADCGQASTWSHTGGLHPLTKSLEIAGERADRVVERGPQDPCFVRLTANIEDGMFESVLTPAFPSSTEGTRVQTDRRTRATAGWCEGL